MNILLKTRDEFLPFPNTKTFVIRCRHETPVLIDERDGVHSAQVAVIFLNSLARTSVPL